MLRLAVIPLVMIALLAGALVWSGEGKQGRADFAYVLKGDHVTLDLNNMSYAIDIRVANALWEGLCMPDPATLEPRLATADRLDVSPDRRTYTFHIRDSARWSNGDKVTANDFLFEWRRMLESPKEYSYLHTKYIKGAEAYKDAYAAYVSAPADRKPAKPDFGMVGERAPDPATLQVEVDHPVPFFLNLLAFCPFFPMHERSMEPFKQVNAATGQVTYDPRFTRPPNLVTNGPYRLASWTYKRRIRMERNEHYWDVAHVNMRSVDEVRADDGLAAYRLYRQGDIDWLATVDTDLAAPLLDANRPELHLAPAFGTVFFEFNCLPKLPDGRPNPLADARVRQALALSVNKQEIVDKIGRLHQPVASTFIPVGAFRGYDAPPGLPYDLDRARKLLAEAGYPDGRGFPRLSILYATEVASNADVATITRRGWKDHLGIDVDPDGMEQKQSASNLNQQKYSVARAAWYGDYLDPSTFTDKYLSGSDNNAAKWADPAYDALCAKAAVEPDPARRLDYFRQAEARLLDQAPIVPLYTDVMSYLYGGDNVHGIVRNPQSLVLFKALSTEQSRRAQ